MTEIISKSAVKHGSTKLGGKNLISDKVELLPVDGDIIIGYASTIGNNCILRGAITIGNYCQLAPRVSMFSRSHPMEHATIYVNKTLFEGRMKSFQPNAPIHVGSDVWIGCGAVILQGVTIGNGAVIGAGAVVTSDVTDYEIVAGNPARFIRRRFEDRIIRLLLELRWWDLTVEQLTDFEGMFSINMVRETDKAVDLLHKYRELKNRLEINADTQSPFEGK